MDTENSSTRKPRSLTKILLLLGLALILVVAAGAVGWWYGENHAKQDLSIKNGNLVSSLNRLKAENRQLKSASPQVNKAPVLVFKSWGVEMPLSNKIKNAYYAMKDPNYAFVALNSDIGTDCAAESTGRGLIQRFKASDVDPDTNRTYLSESSKYAVKAGDYYYVYIGPQAMCGADVNPKTRQQEGDIAQAFAVAAEKIHLTTD